MLTEGTATVHLLGAPGEDLVSEVKFSLFLAPAPQPLIHDEPRGSEMYLLPTGSSSIAPGLSVPFPPR